MILIADDNNYGNNYSNNNNRRTEQFPEIYFFPEDHEESRARSPDFIRTKFGWLDGSTDYCVLFGERAAPMYASVRRRININGGNYCRRRD